MNPLSVNDALSRLDELSGQPVAVSGVLHFEFEDISLNHAPSSERMGNPYHSSIWLTVGWGALSFDKKVCEKWHGKIVTVEGVLLRASASLGGGHMGLWPAELLAQELYRS